MMPVVDMSQGGLIAVILSNDIQLPADYEFNPRVIGMTVDALNGSVDHVERRLPKLSKIVLLTDRLPHTTYENLRIVCEHRNIPYLSRPGQDSLTECLRELLPLKKHTPPDGQKRSQAPHGSLSAFVAKHADLSRGASEEARRLLPIAQTEGLATTLGSLSQALGVAKRKARSGEIPKSAQSKQQQALTILDQAIENLILVRDFVNETEKLNLALQKKVDSFKALLKD